MFDDRLPLDVKFALLVASFRNISWSRLACVGLASGGHDEG